MRLRDVLNLHEVTDVEEPQKISKPVVVYEGPEMNVRDFTCGGCVFFDGTSHCSLLAPHTVTPNAGCNLWVGGIPAADRAVANIPQAMAGYTTEGPFTCERCEYFGTPNRNGLAMCAKVEGPVHAKGCCNHWEKGETP